MKNEYRKAFEVVEQTPRIRPKAVSKELNIRPTTAGALIKDAITQGYIVGPQIRIMSFKNLAEYVYFAKYRYPGEVYQQYVENKDIIYHAIMDGFANMLIISKKKLNIDALFYGLRTDYLFSLPPDCDWVTSAVRMRTMVEQFNPKEYTPKNYITNHWDKTVEWTELDEILYSEFKYNLRKPVIHIMEKHGIQRNVIKDWLKTVPDYCTVFTGYYPETVTMYEPYVYLFETEYEDFIIDLFSQLPTSTWFFKVADNLLLYTWIDRGSMGMVDYRMPEISTLYTVFLREELLKREIVINEAHAHVQFYWREEPI
jgi:hypothetical protein